MRLPYGNDTDPVETFVYEEDVAGPSPDRYLWGNAAFALAACITAAFAKYGWTAAIRGYEGGGAVENLNVYKYRQNGETVALCPTEVSITDRREKELSDLRIHRPDLPQEFGQGGFLQRPDGPQAAGLHFRHGQRQRPDLGAAASIC